VDATILFFDPIVNLIDSRFSPIPIRFHSHRRCTKRIMTFSKRHIQLMMINISIVISVSVKCVVAYIPSIHPNDQAIVSIKPILKKPPNQSETKTDSLSINIAPIKILTVKKVSVSKKKWGTDYDHPEEYWFDDRIHTLGNHGFWGAVHAAIAPFSTKIIDIAAYHGVDVRLKVTGILQYKHCSALSIVFGENLTYTVSIFTYHVT
jgi:hypothetical protein